MIFLIVWLVVGLYLAAAINGACRHEWGGCMTKEDRLMILLHIPASFLFLVPLITRFGVKYLHPKYLSFRWRLDK